MRGLGISCGGKGGGGGGMGAGELLKACHQSGIWAGRGRTNKCEGRCEGRCEL